MNTNNISLNIKTITKIFPDIIVLSRELKILEVGNFYKISSSPQKNQLYFNDLFEIFDSSNNILTSTPLNEHISIRLKSNNNNSKIEGRLELINDQKIIIFKRTHTNSPIKPEDHTTIKNLTKQEEKYRNIIENMNLGLLEVDLEDNIIYCNNIFTKLSGYSKEELLKNKAEELFLSEDQLKTIEKHKNNRLQNISESYEMEITTKSNEKRWWLISGTPRINDNGEIIGSIRIHLDITEQKSLEQKLEKALAASNQSSEEKERFLTNMSHEIRTPLHGIIGMANELEKTNLNTKQEGIVKIINKASEHLLSVLNSILDLSKIEAGETSIEYENFIVHQTFLEIKEFFKKQATLNNVDFKIISNIDENLTINTDKSKIKQITINILNNAIRHSHNKSVSLTLNNDNITKEIQITIQDTGEGMSEEFLNRIFIKFSQENNQNKRTQNGTGLGLLISKELTELLGGKIIVKSKKNIGTTVIISIPYQSEQVTHKTPVEKTSNISIKPNLKILITEDNEMNIEVLKNIFNRHNITYEIATNGEEAITKIKTKPTFDIILMDVQMPIMDGIEATKIIKNELKIKTPIIGISANAFKSEIKKCIESGMVDYITKPFKESKLIELIQTYTSVTPVKKEKLFDIENLMKMSNNDINFTKKMLTLFTKMIDENKGTIELKNEFNPKEYNQLIHKLKASLHNLNAHTTFNLIEQYETNNLKAEEEEKLRYEIKNKIIQLSNDIKSMLVLLY